MQYILLPEVAVRWTACTKIRKMHAQVGHWTLASIDNSMSDALHSSDEWENLRFILYQCSQETVQSTTIQLMER